MQGHGQSGGFMICGAEEPMVWRDGKILVCSLPSGHGGPHRDNGIRFVLDRQTEPSTGGVA